MSNHKTRVMKKSFLSLIGIFAALIVLMAFTYPGKQASNPQEEQTQALFPEDVQKIFETSCYDCHSDQASNLKAKTKLNFGKWAELSDAKKVGKMEEINDEIKTDKMPPSKYIEKYPDHALSQEHKDIVDKWVKEETAKLMGE